MAIITYRPVVPGSGIDAVGLIAEIFTNLDSIFYGPNQTRYLGPDFKTSFIGSGLTYRLADSSTFPLPISGRYQTLEMKSGGTTVFEIRNWNVAASDFVKVMTMGEAGFSFFFGKSDRITATGFADVIRGFGGADTIFGQGGGDSLFGDNGADQMYGGSGSDTLFGGTLGDRLLGGNGGDFLNGDAGRDVIYGGTGEDTIYGGGGNDIIYSGRGPDTMIGLGGSDRFVFSDIIRND